MLGYATIDQVREEAGGIDAEDVTDTDIQEAIEAAEICIINYTVHVWVNTEFSFPLVKQICKLLAASFVMDKFDDPKGEVEKNFNKAMKLLELLTASDEVSADINISVTEYETFPKNPEAGWPRGRLSTVSIGNVVSEDQLLEQASF